MDLPGNLIEPLFERIEAYVKTTLELAKLRAVETGVSVATTLLARLCVFVAALLFLLILSIGLALYLGALLGQPHVGFFIMAGFYLLVGLVLHRFLHKWLQKPVGDFIITQSLQ